MNEVNTIRTLCACVSVAKCEGFPVHLGRLFEWVRWYVLRRSDAEADTGNCKQYGLLRVELALGAIIDLLFVSVVGWFAIVAIVSTIPPVISYRVAFVLSWHLRLIECIWIFIVLASPVYFWLSLGRLGVKRGWEKKLEHIWWIIFRVGLIHFIHNFLLLIRSDSD